ncbi:hypothetical protein UPYG_G00092480 [Umbra pygmaea]|uniref:SH3 domain-containing protein n=1 Tax=Umbra pygmaea TaxID=75934 RepID=A0ABD0XG35_UMBPY
MEIVLAKALYDNTAECSDELAFSRGDVITVLQQDVDGSCGWWMCSLYGRKGLAPANRLQLLNVDKTQTKWKETGCGTGRGDPASIQNSNSDRSGNIYQIPSIPRNSLTSSPTYECMDPVYKPYASSVLSGSSLKMVYDVPRPGRVSLLTVDPPHAPATPDPCYDIPVPSISSSIPPLGHSTLLVGNLQKQPGYCKTLQNPKTSDWIYDVPKSPEKPGGEDGYYSTLPSGGKSGYHTKLPSMALSSARQLDDTLPPGGWLGAGCASTPSFYDPPKPSSSPLDLLSVSITQRDHHLPLECRGDSGPTYNHLHARGRLHRGRMGLVARALGTQPGTSDALLQEDNDEDRKRTATCLSKADNKQRISTASTSSSSSSSSCDSMALCSSSPELNREVCLGQEEACKRLLLLQQDVCRDVPRLMEFVSSSWRSREHLEKHLTEIRSAAEGVAFSVSSFLTFALDVKGNIQRLTDSNLQSRLQRLLSVIEDSGLILQQSVSSLAESGWSLPLLAQDPTQNHTLDQLDRLVMVTRTLPEDIKRLVSMINANAKLLFRTTEKRDTDGSGGNDSNTSSSNTSASNTSTFPTESNNKMLVERAHDDSGTDDNDYVQLQTKKVFEKQQSKILWGKLKQNIASIKSEGGPGLRVPGGEFGCFWEVLSSPDHQRTLPRSDL